MRTREGQLETLMWVYPHDHRFIFPRKGMRITGQRYDGAPVEDSVIWYTKIKKWPEPYLEI